jgi:hypothetical protein
MTTPPALVERDELTRLELLHALKKHFGDNARANRSPFAESRVVRYDTDVSPWDVPAIHGEARAATTEIIEGIHRGDPSQVVILAGEPGMGKSHLINWFRSPQRERELGYVLVCNANSWKVEEFERYLLDGLIEALVRPSPTGPHLLAEKIHDVAFQALGQLLAQPGLIGQFQPRGHPLRRLWLKVTGRHHAPFQGALERRDATVFRGLHFSKFAGHVCDRFLHSSGNPFHRYVLQVLLRYLFDEDRETVLHWLRRRPVPPAFLRYLPAEDAIDQNYKVVDALKILISLFTPEVARPLATNGAEHHDKVFFFAFDQMEGRKELFEREDDWFKFFAQLSELYNTLPNVFILFTMTVQLRNQLYPRMERQFQQRIRREHRFVLERLSDEEVLSVYRHRIDSWLSDQLPDVSRQLDNPLYGYLPFDREEVLAMSGTFQQKTLREMLEAFDEHFCRFMQELVTKDARLDFLVARNQFRADAAGEAPGKYTEDHLASVTELFNQSANLLAELFGLSYAGLEETETTDQLPALRLEFHSARNEKKWVRVFLVRLPHVFNDKLEGCNQLLHSKYTDRNFLWLVRASKAYATWEEMRPGQVFARELFAETEITLRSMLSLLHNREKYPEGEWARAQALLVEELRKTYLGEMLGRVAGVLKDLFAAEAEGEAAPAPPGGASQP